MRKHLTLFLLVTATIMAQCQMSDAQTQQHYLRVRAYIDGSDYLYVRGNQIWYEHIDWQLPGKGDSHNDPTYLNDDAWFPIWNGSGAGAESERHELAETWCVLPTNEATTVSLENNSSRCTVSISSQPSADNDYTLELYLKDKDNGAAWCDFVFFWIGEGVAPITINPCPTITNILAQQRYPWNGKVDVSYTISGMQEHGLLASNLCVYAIDCDLGVTNVATSLSGDMELTDGTHNIVWDMRADGLTFKSTNMVINVSCETTPAPYCVIDISSGEYALSYPVSYLAEPPPGGFNVDEYKTTKMVLRRVEPGSFQMCGQYQTTLTKPYYMGIFEVTQMQYMLVMGNNPALTGNNPSKYTGDMRPVDHVGFRAIRGSSQGAQWPLLSSVDQWSFMGLLQKRTKLNFDLPTEAQWEYACRAGTTSSYNNGGSSTADLKIVGRCSENTNDGKGGYSQHTTVGSYLPNAWGLYDMHGNVSEWCLDWYGNLHGGVTDPEGSSYYSGASRVRRGGSWYSSTSACSSSSRASKGSDYENYYGPYGFRLSRTLPANTIITACTGDSMPMHIVLNYGTQTAALTETICYSTTWETNIMEGVTAVVTVNDEEIVSAIGSGTVEWQPTRNGTYTLVHRVLANGTQIGETLTATFNVSHFPAMPVISPVSGIVGGWPVPVTISCETEGTIIHYTTDGSDPTEESTLYRRFRISERTTIKAIAVKDGLCSEIAVGKYALGQCANPVITPANGATFDWAGQEVSIAWQGEDGILRYTTDGSDPTTNSPVYSEPFTIDDSTIVKAKAFGDQYFDSSIVTAYLTRIWVNVATPAIAAASSFTGSKTEVAISCATEGATIRYTLDGTEPGASSAIYTRPFNVTDSCTVKAYATCFDYLDSAVATQSIEKVWGVGDTLGAPDQVFSTGGDLPFVRVTDNTAPLGESMKSGAITHSQQSTLSTTVVGPGTISFQWKASCEDSDGYYDWDHAEFWVDGTRIAQLDGQTAWQTVTQAVSGSGSHTLLWKYVKDDMSSEGEDCCWVADYHWASAYTATQTTKVPVPYVWLRGYFPHTPDEYDAYESAAKETAANGENKVWECYVAGLVPTNATDVFRAVISIDGEKPVIGWTPDLNEGGTKQERVYTVEGRPSLAEGDWEELRIENGKWKIGNCRFFRVKVALP